MFTGDLNHTWPITLIEHTRKILTKILTNRVTKVLAKYSVLNPYNHVALLGTSTAEPIYILTHIIEDANVNNKELWLLSQDMSKAYDSIYIPLLIKAMQRIKLPELITNLIGNIFANKTNQIITNFDNTESYWVYDRVDQGEMIVPIL